MSYHLHQMINGIDCVQCRRLVSFKQEGTNLVPSNLDITHSLMFLKKEIYSLIYNIKVAIYFKY